METTIYFKGERFTIVAGSIAWRVQGPWEERSYGAYSSYDEYIWFSPFERLMDRGIFAFLPVRKLIARQINKQYKKYQKEKARVETPAFNPEEIERSLRKYN